MRLAASSGIQYRTCASAQRASAARGRRRAVSRFWPTRVASRPGSAPIRPVGGRGVLRPRGSRVKCFSFGFGHLSRVAPSIGGAGRAHAARPAVVRASAFYRDARVGGGRAAPREWFKESSSRRRFHTHLALVRPFLAFVFFFTYFVSNRQGCLALATPLRWRAAG